ncbi:imidazole glycerol phosphate synthase subunit HisH [Corallococcus sp. H22C18031201]|uniref:imidazole glycerol phosphate synthase subunit HisH n=1 Tax=Citreicoccus inhibens TaxID=2849499 RepID=UPI000E70D22A|nr:imidazole glycerol phosphate synthase subunit HisH [Citreicoccus inhibens]MBU8898557.1 imidazole glycerol phosphate synthase subunit HisH [Citreicoccus inhibens]RJS24983.1 imidazole glycerol phosphate synthase subunit HisH [Corallococcus sp. H22C18031201]
MRVTVFDYGAGNLHSLTKALALVAGAHVCVQEDARRALDTDVLVLPGVGAFGAAAARLEPGRERMRRALDDGLPCLGICLGMQLLFEQSEEGPGAGLGYFRGRVTRLAARQVPQMGWNTVRDAPSVEAAGLRHVYYANSYACRASEPSEVVGWTTHEGDTFPASVRRGRVLGVQFHPEKSSLAGVNFLRTTLAEWGS